MRSRPYYPAATLSGNGESSRCVKTHKELFTRQKAKRESYLMRNIWSNSMIHIPHRDETSGKLVSSSPPLLFSLRTIDCTHCTGCQPVAAAYSRLRLIASQNLEWTLVLIPAARNGNRLDASANRNARTWSERVIPITCRFSPRILWRKFSTSEVKRRARATMYPSENLVCAFRDRSWRAITEREDSI